MTTPQAASVPHETYATRFSFRPVALGRRGMVATANPLASLFGGLAAQPSPRITRGSRLMIHR